MNSAQLKRLLLFPFLCLSTIHIHTIYRYVLMLQPLLENAIYHGIEPAAEGGTIRIRFARTRDELLIELANPCLGDTVSSSGNHMALANIRERLGLYYDLEARLETRQEVLPEGACEYHVQIALPYRSAT